MSDACPLWQCSLVIAPRFAPLQFVWPAHLRCTSARFPCPPCLLARHCCLLLVPSTLHSISVQNDRPGFDAPPANDNKDASAPFSPSSRPLGTDVNHHVPMSAHLATNSSAELPAEPQDTTPAGEGFRQLQADLVTTSQILPSLVTRAAVSAAAAAAAALIQELMWLFCGPVDDFDHEPVTALKSSQHRTPVNCAAPAMRRCICCCTCVVPRPADPTLSSHPAGCQAHRLR